MSASSRLPIVMAVVNRALTGPININNDHSDSMGARDSGWLQMYAETNQEAYDNFIQGILISEAVQTADNDLPGRFHYQPRRFEYRPIEDEKVREFVGEYMPENYLLKHENPLAVGPYGVSPYYMEIKREQAQAMKDAMPVIRDMAKNSKSSQEETTNSSKNI